MWQKGNLIGVGVKDGSHWNLGGELHFTEPSLKPLGRGYMFYGTGLESLVMRSEIADRFSLYPAGVERIAALDKSSF